MRSPVVIPVRLLEETFRVLRDCGSGRRECQVLWLGPWATPTVVTEIAHSGHDTSFGGVRVHDEWLTAFWRMLDAAQLGVRVQVHTHPGEAFHSATDDAWPMVSTPGFLSLVIPDFASGEPSLRRAFLTELQPDGTWCEVREISSRLRVHETGSP